MADTREPRVYDLSPGEKSHFWLDKVAAVTGRSSGQLSVACVTGAVMLVTLYLIVAGVGVGVVAGSLILEALAGLALVHVPFRSESTGDRHLADLLLVQLGWLRRSRRRTEYRSAGTAAGVDAVSGMPGTVEPPAEVGPVVWLSTRVGAGDGGETVGIARHLSSDRSVAWLEVEPPARGIGDPATDDRIATALAAIHRQVGNGGLAEILVQVLDVSPAGDRTPNPWDVVPLVDGTPQVIYTGRDEAAAATALSATYRSFHGVVVPWNTRVARAVKFKGGGDNGLGQVMVRELEALASALPDAGYRVLGPLSVSSLVSFTRHCYDPSVQVLPPGRSLSPGAVQRPLDTRYAWPMARRVPTKRYVEVDGWFVSVWEVGLPYQARSAGFDGDLVTGHPEIRRRHVQLRRLTSTAEAIGKFQAATNVSEELAQEASDRGIAQGVRTEMSTAAVRARTQRIGQGDVGASFVEYVIIYGRDESELVAHEEVMRAAGDKCSRPLTPQYADQERALCVGLPMGQGIK